MSEWIDFKALRSQLKIEDVLKRYNVELKVKGDRATGFCPLPCHKSHAEGKRRSPSFSVSLSRNIFNCFSCGAKGNAIDLFAYFEGLDPHDPMQFRQAALKSREKFPLAPEVKPSAPKPPEPTAAPIPAPAKTTTETPAPVGSPRADPATGKTVVNAALDFELKHLDPKHPYLTSRGFNPETIEHFGLGFCAKGLMVDRIAIPLHDAQGRLIGYAGRLVDDARISAEHPKYRFPGARERQGGTYEFHKSAFLYHGDRIQCPVHDLIVVEGFPSVWWLWQHGYKNAVALMGSNASPEQCRLLQVLLQPDGRLWIITDGDEAGQVAAHGILLQVSPHRFVRWVKLNAGRQPTDCSPEEMTSWLATA